MILCNDKSFIVIFVLKLWSQKLRKSWAVVLVLQWNHNFVIKINVKAEYEHMKCLFLLWEEENVSDLFLFKNWFAVAMVFSLELALQKVTFQFSLLGILQ